MVHLIDVPEDLTQPPFRIPGWRVAVSQRVWAVCVALPDGVEGQTEEIRLWDLLVYLWSEVRHALAYSTTKTTAIRFETVVMNDKREDSGDAEDRVWPTTGVRLAAL